MSEVSNKWVAFDFDGTIADTKGFLVTLYNRSLSKTYGGIPVAPHDIERLCAMSLPKILSHLKISPFKLPFLVRAARREIGLNINCLEIFDGMRTLLADLHNEGYKTAIISSNNNENIRAFCEVQGITTIDDIACDAGASLFAKAKTIHKFMKKHAISRTDLVYVGDEIRDITACRKEGVRVISVTWGFDPATDLAAHHPDLLAETVETCHRGIHSLFA